MNNTDWKSTAELIGIAAVVASLLFVGLQLRQDQDIAEAQIFAQSNQLTIDLSSLVNEHRGIWLRGINGEELSAEDEVVFENLFAAVLFNYGGLWQRANRLDTRSPESAAKQMAYHIFAHPGLRRMWEERGLFEAERDSAFEGGFPVFGFQSRHSSVFG